MPIVITNDTERDEALEALNTYAQSKTIVTSFGTFGVRTIGDFYLDVGGVSYRFDKAEAKRIREFFKTQIPTV